MSDHSEQLVRIAALRLEKQRADERLRATRRQQTAVSAELAETRRLGAAGARRAAQLERELERLSTENEAQTRRFTERNSALADALTTFSTADDPTTLVERLDDRLPILLLPARVETRFMPVTAPTELWVRIFPDDIAVHAHETELTAKELAAGRAYWDAVAAAESLPEGERRTRRTAAWQSLAGTTEGPRAAWIVLQTNPSITADETIDRTDDASAPEAWGRAPRSNLMPDRFAVILQAQGRADRTEFGSQIPDPLILGPDPSAKKLDIARGEDGEIELADDLRWMHEFDAALAVGMAVKIPLSAVEASTGFDRVFVLGLRLSSDPQQTRKLVEDLIDNHHYSPDGAALVPQGTPTNNTSGGSAGFRSTADPAESEAIELGEPLFTPVDAAADRRDAQWLAEALGIGYSPFTHLAHADSTDVREARLMNQALWHATLGYYLEQMLGVDAATVRRVEEFFVQHASGRGPLPALRVGTQPYGVLVTSDTRQWRASDSTGVESVAQDIQAQITRVEGFWDAALASVSFAGKAGDSHAHLLNMLGLHATSVDYFRRQGFGSGYIWNYLTFMAAAAGDVRRSQSQFASEVLQDVGRPVDQPLPVVDLTFFSTHSHITDPVIDDVPGEEDERFSERDGVRRLYKLDDSGSLHNYLRWLHASSVADIKAQTFRSATDAALPVPRPLLYRMLRHALLLANVDAALQLYEANGVVSPLARREVELPNVRADRTVTRWEFLEARVDRVLPQLDQRPMQVVEFLGTDAARRLPSVSGLVRVRAALEGLIELPTARLERLFAEHVDLCSYRLDAWQTALFTERLRVLRDPQRTGLIADRALGLHLGAFGWLEDVRPGVLATPVNPAVVPEALRDPDRGVIVEQPDSGGSIHGLSTTHAVAGAVLRNAYLTHASPAAPEIMSVDLSSERVRLAMSCLEGIANGQSLGALLGYQFQRGLKERHGDPSLAAFIPNFRDACPMRADKITPGGVGTDAALKDASHVFDGYLLLERTLLAEPPIGYPYGVADLPAAGTTQAAAIQQEVERMAQTMDAVGDLSLAEGVFQVAHGNYDRSGAMLQAIARGAQPPEPEIVRTPRSGAAVNHRVALHLDPVAGDRVWTDVATPRSQVEPALNAWLGERLGDPATLRFVVKHGADQIEDASPSLADLAIEPLDLVHLIGEELGDGESELVRRIRHAYRRAHGGAGASAVQTLTVAFPAHHAEWGAEDRSLFEAMPLIAALKRLATVARPLGAGDYMLPSEDNTDPATDPNPQRFDDAELNSRLTAAFTALSSARQLLGVAISVASALDPSTAASAERAARLTVLIDATRALAPFGFPDAFVDARAVPLHAGESPTPFERALAHHLDLAASVLRQADTRLAEARRLREFTDLDATEIAALTIAQKVERYRDAARQLLGSGFNLLPRFVLKNAAEVTAARAFREQPLESGLLRHAANPMIVEEWFQGVACVRERLGTLETLATLGDALGRTPPPLRALQLPFRVQDYWVAVEYPEVPSQVDPDVPPPFRPVGDFLSVVQSLPPSGFDPGAQQTGLLLDAWTETIPTRVETTGIAVHYNQPNAQPAQVLMLAVAPVLTGHWTWNGLVGVLSDTLRRAKLRAVEPDQLQTSALGHLLPAILTPVASRPFATVSADLLNQTAVAFADAGGPSG